MTNFRDSAAVSRALRNIREFGETHSHPVSKPTQPAAPQPQETASQEAPGGADTGAEGLEHGGIAE
jgi:hypothetical protein